MNMKIFFICSDMNQRDALAQQLPRMSGVDFNVLHGSVKTLFTVLKERPDVVVLDYPVSDPASMEQIKTATLQAPGVYVALVSPDGSPELLRRAMQAGVRDILPAPMSAATVERALGCVQEREAFRFHQEEGRGKVLAFVPAKGGAGATFLATNLAYALATHGHRVLVVDLNLYFGDAALFVADHPPTSSVVDLAREMRRMDAALLDACVLKARENLHLLAAPISPHQLDLVTPDAVERIVGLARAHYDFVILDLSRTLTPATVKALDLAERIHLTLQLTLPCVQDAKRMTAVFRELGYPLDKLQLVVNRYEKSGLVNLDEVERATGIKVRRTVPNSFEAVNASVNEGIPLLLQSPRDPVARLLLDWGQELLPTTVSASAGKSGRGWFQSWRRAAA